MSMRLIPFSIAAVMRIRMSVSAAEGGETYGRYEQCPGFILGARFEGLGLGSVFLHYQFVVTVNFRQFSRRHRYRIG